MYYDSVHVFFILMRGKRVRRVYIFALPWECPVPQMAKTVNQIVLHYFTVKSVNQRVSEKRNSWKKKKVFVDQEIEC